MTSLISLPNELSWNIVSALEIEDVVSFSRACKWSYQYVHSNHVSRAVIQTKVPFSRESIATPQTAPSCALALRKWTKRMEALTSADPYSVAILGVGLSYLYCQGDLWYMVDDTLRLLETRQSPTEELVIDVPNLLSVTAFASQPNVAGSFSFLYYHDGVLSCLYRFSPPRQGGWLVVVDVKKYAVLLSQEIDSTEKLFARHNAEYLYYGIHKSNDYDGRKRWVLYGYDLGTRKFLGQNNFLYDLIGADLGSTICFEIKDGFFYAVSNQTTYEVEEVDWTSFYHCRRFPLSKPCEKLLERTEDKSMWRRQHLEGPLDDRWTTLALTTDQASGDLTIVESRKEWLQGRSTGQRSVYKTKVVFPASQLMKNNLQFSNMASYIASPASLTSSESSAQSLATLDDSATSSTAIETNCYSSMDTPSQSDEDCRRLSLVALTQDRLALTVTAANKPHYLPPQIRLPRNVHSEPIKSCQRSFILSKTPAKYYNLSASSFVDLVNDPPEADPTISQCLRIRVGSRRMKPPVRDDHGIMPPEGRDPYTGQIVNGLNEEYEDRHVASWPPALSAYGHQNEASKDLHALMNPPAYIGNVHGTFDETSLVYTTGEEGQPKPIILVNFDASIKLHGLKKWHGTPDAVFPEVLADEEMPRAKRRKTTPCTNTRAQSNCVPSNSGGPQEGSTSENRWLRSEPAMYLSIARGYDFGL